MKRLTVFIITLALALTGCSTTRTVKLDNKEDSSYAKINRLGKRHEAAVTIGVEPASNAGRDHLDLKVNSLQLAPDTTSWFNVESGQWEHVATARIASIMFERTSARNVIGGTLLGGVLGFVAGAFIGGDRASKRGSCELLFCEDKALLGSLYGFLIGSVAGGGIGAIKLKACYRLEAPAPAPPAVAEEVKQQRLNRKWIP